MYTPYTKINLQIRAKTKTHGSDEDKKTEYKGNREKSNGLGAKTKTNAANNDQRIEKRLTTTRHQIKHKTRQKEFKRQER